MFWVSKIRHGAHFTCWRFFFQNSWVHILKSSPKLFALTRFSACSCLEILVCCRLNLLSFTKLVPFCRIERWISLVRLRPLFCQRMSIFEVEGRWKKWQLFALGFGDARRNSHQPFLLQGLVSLFQEYLSFGVCFHVFLLLCPLFYDSIWAATPLKLWYFSLFIIFVVLSESLVKNWQFSAYFVSFFDWNRIDFPLFRQRFFWKFTWHYLYAGRIGTWSHLNFTKI